MKKNKTPKKYTHSEWVISAECNGWKEKTVTQLLKLFVAMAVLILKDDYGLNTEQLHKFRKRMDEISGDINNGVFTESDLIRQMELEEGIKG